MKWLYSNICAAILATEALADTYEKHMKIVGSMSENYFQNFYSLALE